MDFAESAEDVAFRADVRDYVRTHLPNDIRRKAWDFIPLERHDYARWHQLLNVRGWSAPSWPKEYGGPGWTGLQRKIFEEEAMSAGAPRQFPHVNAVGRALQIYGSPQQKARFLPRILSFDDVWCQGYSEPGAGSDLAALQTRAVRDGDRYVVDGEKIWTSFAEWADWMFCLVRTSTEGKPQSGISVLLIDMKSPGISVRPLVPLGGKGDLTQVHFDRVEVPAENLVGTENAGWTVAKGLLGHERSDISSVPLGKFLLQRIKALAAREHKHGLPLIDDVRFRDRVVKVEMDLTAQEWTLMRVLFRDAAHLTPGPEASILKIRGSELVQEMTELLMECAGPQALPYVRDSLAYEWSGPLPAERDLHLAAANYFDWRKVTIYGGTTEVQKNIVAKTVLDL